MKNFVPPFLTIIVLFTVSCGRMRSGDAAIAGDVARGKDNYSIHYSDEEWKSKLTAGQYYILVKEGTEAPGSGKYDHFYEKGTYYSAASLQPLFSSAAKFNSGTGWPSFYEPINNEAVKLIAHNALGMEITEVVDGKTGLHLGHVFDDGPAPTGKRYCMNSDALIFVPEGGKPPTASK
ncbi:MAG: peptide-methionine (R)-S-oxide reductase MsrB [Flavitalea sp.]